MAGPETKRERQKVCVSATEGINGKSIYVGNTE